MTLGDRLRELRGEHGMTLKDLSGHTGLSVSYLSDMERGRTAPSLDTLTLLSDAFDMTVTDLLTGVDWAGERTDASLPSGLRELKDDPNYQEDLTDDWIELLIRVELRGARPTAKEDWLELYLHLRRILEQEK
jgi:transcriptional regulator with XRE-family HTH domain